MCTWSIIALLVCALTHGTSCGIVLSVEGHVELTRRGVSKSLSQGENLIPGDRIISADGAAIIQLTRGGQFAVFPSSSIIFRRDPLSLPSWIATIRTRIGRFGLSDSASRRSKAVMAVRG
ncbi:MAG TPA: hypothetical protein VKU01_32000 [Bryobacteraceae bacterium]|nr:hypothetical protein [Bryobacteraceae bacterium]